MIDLIPTILLGVLIGGTILLWLGRRGARVNDHPSCRRCGFDLLGVYPGRPACPECGADLTRPRMVRTGVRQRRRGLVVVGSLLLGLGVLVLLGAAWLMFAGPTMNRYKPSIVLAIEGRHMGAEASKEAAAELLSRLNNDEIGDGAIAWVVEAALAVQADLRLAWSPAWGDIVEGARMMNKVSDAEYERFMRQSVVVEITARPAIGSGKPAPLLVGVTEWRRANAPSNDVRVWVEKFSFDAQPVTWARYGDGLVALDNVEDGMNVATSQNIGWTPKKKAVHADTLPLELGVPANVSSGSHTIEVRLQVGWMNRTAGVPAMGLGRGDWTNVGEPMVRRRTISIEQATATARPRPSSDGADARLHEFLSGSNVEVVYPGNGWGDEDEPKVCLVRVTVPRASSPEPYAFEVFVQIGGREYVAGVACTGQLPRSAKLGLNAGALVADIDTTVEIVAEVPLEHLIDADASNCEVVFRPSLEVAEATLNQTEFHPNEISVSIQTTEIDKPRPQSP